MTAPDATPAVRPDHPGTAPAGAPARSGGAVAAVGVLGCTGAVGRALVRRLREAGIGPLRLGGRDLTRVEAVASRLATPASDPPHRAGVVPVDPVRGVRPVETVRGVRPVDPVPDVGPVETVPDVGPVEAVRVDVEDARALAAFCGGCRVVVNCAGPSARVLDTVARAALAAGAAYVDVAGDQIDRAPLRAVAAREAGPPGGPGPGGTAVLGAGMMPGLSALLPRHLAAGFSRVDRLVAYVGGLDPFTPAAARDYVASLAGGHGTPLAAWRDGGPVRGALRPARGVRLPGWPGRVSVYPYLAAETERLARTLRIAEVEWWTVFDGDRTLDALARAGDAEPERAAEALVLASRLEAFGREPYFQMVFELTGDGGGRTLVARTGQSHELSAAVAAAATAAVLRGQMPAGVHEAGDVLSPREVFGRLDGDPALTRLTVRPVTRAAGDEADAPVEEGVL
ncbi:saccharopine dehydrogenase NADP-binding domain-containing protein [Nonomuraea indica]|uniref:Saccharopine dehydrogenase NADP-binding domain-containing protein n=1 Tax=Nonomuraea indica TaxID=1581193 RepID=A0ABW8AEH4_9ACTN